MLKFAREYKFNWDFKGAEFEADLQSLYTEVRRCMASLYRDALPKRKQVLKTLPLAFQHPSLE